MQTPTQIQSTRLSKAHASADVPLAKYGDGRVFALSLSQPGQVYELRKQPMGWSCPCAGFAHRADCCHVRAASERYGQSCWHCGAVEQVELYVNHYDGDRPIELCQSCSGH